MARETDIRPVAAALHLLPVQTRMPLKFGPEVLSSVVCARVRLDVVDHQGRRASGWGETPLSVQWVWPAPKLSYADRLARLIDLCKRLVPRWANFDVWGHPLEIGHDFLENALPQEARRPAPEPALAELPHLAALVCNASFDLALHDAYGQLHGVPTYATYQEPWMNRDLSAYLQPDSEPGRSQSTFACRYPADFLVRPREQSLAAWHLVGGKDPLEPADLAGDEPQDDHPVLLRDWIGRDGLTCLKVKLTGTDSVWDFERLVRVGQIALENGCQWLSADFNCTVQEPAYVNAILDRLARDHAAISDRVLYVEQPFPYDLPANPIDVHSVSTRKPLFMDESAHDWTLVRLGRSLGWTGVALKTCKTQTGALLSLCWARAHGMALMVQDLTNPMLAQIPHVQLAAHAGTIMGVETNSMQYYPKASEPEARVHPGLFQRRHGRVDLASVHGPGFGYRVDEIERQLPPAAAQAEAG